MFFQFQGKLTPAAARSLLKFGFSESDQAAMEELSTKAGAGALTPPEQTELDAYERLDCVLGVIHSRARQRSIKSPSALLNGMNQALADFVRRRARRLL